MQDPLLCTIAEGAALLRISVDTIRRSIRLGIIPTKRIRTNIRISRAWLDSYVAECAPVLLTRRQVTFGTARSPRSVHPKLDSKSFPLQLCLSHAKEGEALSQVTGLPFGIGEG